MKTFLALGVAVALGSGNAFAQGADDCANAQPISGTGMFAFDNTSATTDGPSDCGASSQPVRRDVWFDWTAPSTGSFRFRTCAQTSLQTRIAAYDGTACPPTTQLGCAANTCTGQSHLFFNVVQGQHYLLRVGSRQVGASGSGTFELSFDPCPSAMDDSLEDNDTCDTANVFAGPIVNQPGLHVTKTDPDWYAFELADQFTVQIDLVFTHATGDIDMFLYDGCDGTEVAVGGSATDDEQIIYQNLEGCDQFLKLRVEHWLPDDAADCNDYDMTISGIMPGTGATCEPGTNYCTSVPTSTGSASMISGSGSSSIAANDLVLSANNMPQQPGIFIAGPTQAAIPFFNGTLCISPTGLQRFLEINVPDAGGVITQAVDYTSSGSAVGFPGPLLVMPGVTYNYQRWNRDPAAGGGAANFSDGYAILHTP